MTDFIKRTLDPEDIATFAFAHEDDDVGVKIGADTDSGGNPAAVVEAESETATDVALVLKKKGSAAVQFDDAGNARGNNAVDLQQARGDASNVASGAHSGVLSGQSNAATVGNAVVCGGIANQISAGTSSVIGGGSGNTIPATGTGNFIGGGVSNSHSSSSGGAVICGGQGNSTGGGFFNVVVGGFGNSTATAGFLGVNFIGGGSGNSITEGQINFIGQGFGNTVEGTAHSIMNGASNSITGTTAGVDEIGCVIVMGNSCTIANQMMGTVLSGQGITIDAHHSTALTGNGVRTETLGQVAWNSTAIAAFPAQGDAQCGEYHIRIQTTDATSTRLDTGTTIQAHTDNINIPADTAIYFELMLVAKEAATANTARFARAFTAVNNGGTTTVGAITTMYADDNIPAWGGPTITADDPNDQINLSVVGAAVTTINWSARLKAVQVGD